jgi:hypothetical protein
VLENDSAGADCGSADRASRLGGRRMNAPSSPAMGHCPLVHDDEVTTAQIPRTALQNCWSQLAWKRVFGVGNEGFQSSFLR